MKNIFKLYRIIALAIVIVFIAANCADPGDSVGNSNINNGTQAPGNSNPGTPEDPIVPITFTVTYSGNGSTGGTIPANTTTFNAGATVTVFGNTGSLIKTGHTFVGWNTAPDGTGSAFTEGETFIISTNTTLHAQWLADAYGITLSIDGTDVTSSTYDFPSASYGYGDQTARTVIVRNTGNVPTGTLTIAPNNSGSFTLSSFSIENIDAGQIGFFTVVPKTGLAAVGHSETFTLTGIGGITASFVVSFTVTPLPITTAAVTVTAPVRGTVPSSNASGTGNFSVSSVTWSPSHNPFQGNTQYTAQVTLTANPNNTFTGLTSATINGQAASISNNTGAQVTLSYQFPATEKTPITSAVVTVIAPQVGVARSTVASISGNYTASSVTWSPSHNPFQGNTQYTAQVTLTANTNYTFTGLTGATVNGQTAVVSNNTGTQVTLSYTFPATQTAGLYAKAPPILASDTPVDISTTNGSTIIDKAVEYINANPRIYTLLLDSDVTVAGHTSDQITNGTASRHFKTTNANLTIIGLASERKISLSSTGSIFIVGAAGQIGIALTLGDNITLVGHSSNFASVVYVQNNAAFTMQNNSKVTGNIATNNSSNIAYSGNGGGIFVDNATFTMRDDATVINNTVAAPTNATTYYVNSTFGGGVFVNGGSLIMQDNASVTRNTAKSYQVSSSFNAGGTGGGICVKDGTFTMSDSASVYNNIANGTNYGGGGVAIYKSNFTMSGNASVYSNTSSQHGGGVYMEDTCNFTMSGNASVYRNTATAGGGVYSYYSFIMQDNTSVYDNTARQGGGVFFAGGTFNMSGNSSVSGNTSRPYGGGGVLVGGTFTMSGGTISGNTSQENGGGVYVSNGKTFTMHGGIISGNTASSNGGGVYVGNGIFNKTSGGTIYGYSASDTVNSNKVNNGTVQNNRGHAIYAYGNVTKRKETTTGAGVYLSFDGSNGTFSGGWDY